MASPDKQAGPSRLLGGAIYKVLYFFSYLLLWIFTKLCFCFRYRRDKRILTLQGPVLILANHQCFYDPFFLVAAMRGKRLRFVVGYFLRYFSKWSGLMRYLDAIPIQQFSADTHAVRRIYHAMKNGEWVLVYPEGQRSIDGRNLDYSTSILKIAERAKAHVLTFKLSGAYLAYPRWLGHFRLGPVRGDLEILCTKDQLADQGHQAFSNALKDRLHQDDHAWARKKRRCYLSLRRCLGLHLILHRCPACGQAEALVSSRKDMTCTACGATYHFAGDLSFTSPSAFEASGPLQDIADWHEWQIACERAYLGQTPDLSQMPCQLTLISKETGEVLEEGRGLLDMTPQGLALQTEDLACCADLHYDSSRGLMFNQGSYIQITLPEGVLRIFPDDPYKVIRLVDAGLALAREKQEA